MKTHSTPVHVICNLLHNLYIAVEVFLTNRLYHRARFVVSSFLVISNAKVKYFLSPSYNKSLNKEDLDSLNKGISNLEKHLDTKDKYAYFLDANHALIEITNESKEGEILVIKDRIVTIVAK